MLFWEDGTHIEHSPYALVCGDMGPIWVLYGHAHMGPIYQCLLGSHPSLAAVPMVTNGDPTVGKCVPTINNV